MITQLAHICIHSTDIDATARFYTEGLGLEMGLEFIKDGELFGYYLNLGNDTFIEVFKGESREVGNIDHIAIQTDDIDGIIQRVKDHGYEIGKKSLGCDHSWQVWTADPNGVRIEFHEYTEKSLQLAGGTCEVNW